MKVLDDTEEIFRFEWNYYLKYKIAPSKESETLSISNPGWSCCEEDDQCKFYSIAIQPK